MTDNDKKLNDLSKQYHILKLVADLSPLITFVLMVVMLCVSITMTAYIVKIQASSKAQDAYRETIMKYREQRIATEQKILDNQASVRDRLDAENLARREFEVLMTNKINQVILNQASGHIRSIQQKSVLDTVKEVLLNKIKN